jgi:hypothetical protein
MKSMGYQATRQEGQKSWRSGRFGSGEDQLGKRRDDGCAWGGEPCPEVILKCDAELGAGLGEGEEGVATVSAEVAAGAAPLDFLGPSSANIAIPALRTPLHGRSGPHFGAHRNIRICCFHRANIKYGDA